MSQNQSLFTALLKCDHKLVLQSIERGADFKSLSTHDIHWHQKNKNDPILVALKSNFESKQEELINILETLIQNGAELNVKTNKKHVSNHQYTVRNSLFRALTKIRSHQNKIKFLQTIKKISDINLIFQIEDNYEESFQLYKPILIIMMESFGIQLQSLRCLDTFNFDQFRKKRQLQLQYFYNKENPQSVIFKDLQEKGQSIEQLKSEKKNIEENYLYHLKQVLQLGASVNDFHIYETKRDYFSVSEVSSNQQEKEECSKDIKVSPLHIAIANNLPDLVQLFLQYKADINGKCQFTLRIPIFPNEWLNHQKERRKKNNLYRLQVNERRREQKRIQYLQWWGTWENQQYKKDHILEIQKIDFEIFKIKVISIQDQMAQTKYTKFELECLGLAAKLKASEKMVGTLKGDYYEKI